MSSFDSGRLVVALAHEGKVRLLVVAVPGPTAELAHRHGLGPAAKKRAGEGLVAAALLSSHIKGEERLTLDLQVSNPPCSGVFEVNGDGTMRGRFRPQQIEDEPGLTGYMSAMKSLGRQELYRSVGLINGESIEAALQRYLLESQQVDAKVRLGVVLDELDGVDVAAGFLVERLPHMPPEEFAALAGLLDGELTPLMDAFAFGQFAGGPVEVLGAADLTFQCTCSRARVRATLKALGRDEIAGMIADQGGAEVTCHFCNEVYRLDVAELEAMRAEIGEA